MDVEILSRMQFAFTLSFHYIYPPLSIGLSIGIIYMEWQFFRTGSKHWEAITQFWIRVFAMTFALGVATGIPLQFSLGTNWARYSRFVGDIFGSILAAEGVFAFLVEAGFLGILLFGWNKVSHKIHFMATILVSLAAHFSALWIVVANSWMHTPAGHKIVTEADGVTVARMVDWWQVVLNPSSIGHVVHVIFSCWMAGALLIMSVSAYYFFKKRHEAFAKDSMKIATVITLVAAVLQLISADYLAKVIAKHNPEKMAAFEGVFETEPYAPLYVAGVVDVENRKVTGVKIPGALSFLIHGDASNPVKGLNDFPRDQWPWVQAVFQMYHFMVASWGLIFLAGALGAYLWYTDGWTKRPWVLKYLIISVVLPQLAGFAGWFSACMGRQPWTVYKLLKTSEAYSENISADHNLLTLVMFMLTYLMFFALFLVLLDKKIKHGPKLAAEHVTYRDIK